ncbi:MAG: Cna B-type domain-containing protein [Enterococcus sp.]|uniref:Cna B-type domain-containing protein n=1 Tax=Enterococcus sp. TaxID=35783 RepID=UPI00399398FA
MSTRWEHLPEKESGKDVRYSVKEVNTPRGYEETLSEEINGEIVITNTHTPGNK